MSEDRRALRAEPQDEDPGTTSADSATAPAETVSSKAVTQRTDIVSHLTYVLKSMRPRQWMKGLIVFLALIFSIEQEWQVSDAGSWAPLFGRTALVFVFFCLVSSADYLINDLADRENDRRHPKKRHRPIAAGLLSPRAAIGWAAALALVGLSGGFALDWQVGSILAGYVVLMLGYTFALKHMVLMDMLTISAGFVLRAMAGAVAIDVPISPWLYIVTALGALFLVIHKRRAELTLLEAGAGSHRPILDEYNAPLLDQMASLVTASTLTAYGLYTFTAENLPDNNAMMLTIPFVLYGLLRYLYLVHQRQEGGSPEEVLLRDWPLIIDIVLWLATAGAVLVIFRE